MLDERGLLSRAAVGSAGCWLPSSYDRALWALRVWLDCWPGIGHVAVGMHRQGYDLQLTQYDDRGWRATFYTTGMEHSPTSATGTAWERTPCHATQRAAWEALKRMQVLSLLLFLTALVSGCATAFEFPKTGQAWGQIVEETPGKPEITWTSQAACEAAYTKSWGRGPCLPSGARWMKPHWDKPSRSIYL